MPRGENGKAGESHDKGTSVVGRRRRDGGFELVDKLFEGVAENLGLACEGGSGTL